jgi:hypothetical protein
MSTQQTQPPAVIQRKAYVIRVTGSKFECLTCRAIMRSSRAAIKHECAIVEPIAAEPHCTYPPRGHTTPVTATQYRTGSGYMYGDRGQPIGVERERLQVCVECAAAIDRASDTTPYVE